MVTFSNEFWTHRTVNAALKVWVSRAPEDLLRISALPGAVPSAIYGETARRVDKNVHANSVVPSTHGRAQSQPSATDKNISLYTNPIHILSVLYILPLSQDGGYAYPPILDPAYPPILDQPNGSSRAEIWKSNLLRILWKIKTSVCCRAQWRALMLSFQTHQTTYDNYNFPCSYDLKRDDTYSEILRSRCIPPLLDRRFWAPPPSPPPSVTHTPHPD